MLEPKLEEWTIVIVGNWNVSIFNPKWLTENIFDADSLSIEVPLVFGLPPRIKGDDIFLLPSLGRVVAGITSLCLGQLQKIEDVSVKLLKLLPHTPVTKVGMNYGFVVENPDSNILSHFPLPDTDDFSANQLVLGSRSYGYQFSYKNAELNASYKIENDKLNIKFNFEYSFPDAPRASEGIVGKYLEHYADTKTLLKEIYNLEMEDTDVL